ncbi:MAG: VOC family protein [Acidobacteriota bacterium]
MEESIRFYTDVMGFENRTPVRPWSGRINYSVTRRREHRVEIIQNPTGPPGLYSIGMEVDDLEATVQELKEKGVKILMAPIPITVGYLVFVEDPNGARIALIQHR